MSDNYENYNKIVETLEENKNQGRLMLQVEYTQNNRDQSGTYADNVTLDATYSDGGYWWVTTLCVNGIIIVSDRLVSDTALIDTIFLLIAKANVETWTVQS
jgi:hypothetical protein